MSVFILDTDTLSFVQHNNPIVLDAVDSTRSAGHILAITAITVEEQATGWFAEFRAARTHVRRARLSYSFSEAVQLWGTFHVLPQTEASLSRFDALVALKLNVGKMDLRIASIALELGATVVTHNIRDFSRVPGLLIVDWIVMPTSSGTP